MATAKEFVVIGILAVVSLSVFDSSNLTLPFDARFDNTNEKPESSNLGNMQENENAPTPARDNMLSDSGSTGILNPADVEQSGFMSTGFTNARTDNGFNTNTTLDIDSANNWVASKASADIWNLQRRYAVNGTFDEGIPGQSIIVNDTQEYYPYGWTADNISTNEGQTQVAGYDDTGYVIVENQGTKIGNSGVKYDHVAGTRVFWKQNIANIPYTKNFTLNFRYFYSRGPIDRPGGDDIAGDCSLNLFVNGSVIWKQSLLNITGRGLWIETGDIPIDIANAGKTLEVGIGVAIDETMNLNAEEDYDNDSVADGLANTIYLTVNIDDVSFTGLNPPSFEEVDFRFHAGNESTPATGSEGNGSVTLLKAEYWTTNELDIAFTSNTSIAFNYEAHLLEHRFLNSSWRTSTADHGVKYTIFENQNAELTLYTYVGTQGNYQEFNVTVRYPFDWENVTVYDPFLNDVTAQCVTAGGAVLIPTPLLESLGWWEIILESPNYAESLSSQKYVDDSQWITALEFRPDNITRASVEVRTESETPVLSDPVNLTWYLPNGTLWWHESISSGTTGPLNSSSVVFGVANTTPGLWHIEMEWTNGSEVGYTSSSFSLYHIASLTPEYNIVEGDVGQTITNVLHFQNGYTGEYLMGDDATLTGNWSAENVQFTANVVKNWWEGDFDTSLSGGGNFTVVVQSSKPYYDNASCTFHIVATYSTQLITDAPVDFPAEIGLNENYTLNISYQISNNTGIEQATISTDYTGPTDGLEIYSAEPQSPGEYRLVMTGRQSGTYVVTVQASKDYHHAQSDSFSLIVGKTGTTLTQLNGTGGIAKYGQEYKYVCEFRNSSGSGLDGADVSIVDVEPLIGLEIGQTNDLDEGYYSILLTGNSAGTYTIVVKANLTNHETQYATFSLTISEIPSTLTSYPSSSTIAFDLNQTVELVYEDENGTRLEGANITVLNLPEGLEVAEITDMTEGLYHVILDPSEIGSYSILIRASLDNYQNSTVGFSLLVEKIPTDLQFLNTDASASVNFSDSFMLEMVYTRTDLNINITGAILNVTLNKPSCHLCNVTSFGDLYRISFNTTCIGSWTISIEITKENYETKTREFKLIVQNIQTTITDLTLQEDLLYAHTYSLDYKYLVNTNRTGIDEADVSVAGVDDDWIEIFSQGDGIYRINLTPTRLGSYFATISFSKEGYVSQTASLEFHVDEVPVDISVLDELSDIAGEEKTVRIRAYERGTDIPIANATITYLIFGAESGLWKQGTFSEEGSGFYSATFTMPPADNQNYRLEIRLDKPNYFLEEDLGTYSLTPYLSEEVLMSRFITTYMLPSSIILGGLLVAYGGYVLYRRKRQEEIIEQNRIKRIFTDVHNLLGVLVLNRESGIPVHSRIIKEGLDDTVISAFISAITQFKAEFDLASPYQEWDITPISDLIRIVVTENLICAFIVLREPSDAQKEKMKLFAQEVASIWKDVYQEMPSEVLDSETKRQFDKLFDDIMDARLLKKHRVANASNLPERLQSVDDDMEVIDSDGFLLQNLAQNLAARGIEEGKAYSIIMDGLENGAIVEKEHGVSDRAQDLPSGPPA